MSISGWSRRRSGRGHAAKALIYLRASPGRAQILFTTGSAISAMSGRRCHQALAGGGANLSKEDLRQAGHRLRFGPEYIGYSGRFRDEGPDHEIVTAAEMWRERIHHGHADARRSEDAGRVAIPHLNG